MTALEADLVAVIERAADREWATIAARAPQLAVTGRRYLAQIGVSLQPRSVDAADNTLRIFVAFLTETHPDVGTFAGVGRVHIEDFKTWLQRRRAPRGGTITANTIRQRLGTLRSFFDRIIEWDWPDAPARTPIFGNDLPIVDDPLPRFLDDPTFARLMRATADAPALDRLVIELLAGTGMRVGELCGLQADAVTVISGATWLRVPVGKLHNDRYVPLMPRLVDLLTDWLAMNSDRDRLLHRRGSHLDRFTVARMLDRVARRAGIGHVHPHQLRHTLATQAFTSFNRGMRLEAIATLLGHRSLRMTLVYARIANRTVAEEYHAVSTKVEALYADSDAETPAMRQLRNEFNRMLGNGWCTRPNEMGCTFEAVCEGCGFFTTTIDFKPTLQRQRDHAEKHRQPERVAIYDRLLDTIHDPIEAIS